MSVQKARCEWKVIVGKILGSVLSSLGIEDEDFMCAVDNYEKSSSSFSTSKSYSTLRNWKVGIQFPQGDRRAKVFEHIKSLLDSDTETEQPKYTIETFNMLLNEHGWTRLFETLIQPIISEYVINVMKQCLTNSKTKLLPADELAKLDNSSPLRLIDGHYSKNKNILHDISKAKNEIFISGSGLQHIYDLSEDKLFSKIAPNVSITFAIQDYENINLRAFFLRSSEEWKTRESMFYKGVDNIKAHNKNVSVIKLTTFMPVAYVAVDYKTESDNSFVYVSYYLMSTEESEKSHLKRHSFKLTKQDGAIYDDYCEQISQIEKYGTDLFQRYDEIGMPNPNNDFQKKLSKMSYAQILKLIFGKSQKYAFDTTKQNVAFAKLFPVDNKTSFEYHYILLPLEQGIFPGEDSIQRGSISGSIEKGICSLVAEGDNSRGDQAKYNGFAVILDPSGKAGNCWFFLKAHDDESAELVMFCFRLRGEELDTWNMRVAEVLTLKGIESRPVICRAIISKKRIDDSEIKYFRGHLKLSRGTIDIPKKLFDGALSFFENDSHTDIEEHIRIDIKEHFLDKNGVANILSSIHKEEHGNVYKIHFSENSPGGSENLKLFIYNTHSHSQSPLVLSWLRKHNIAPDNNQVLGKLDADVESMVKWLDHHSAKNHKST